MLTCSCFSQNINLDKVYSELNNYKANKAISLLEKIDTLKATTYDKALVYYFLGEAHLMNDNHGIAYKQTLKAKVLFIKTDSIKNVANCNINILKILSHQNDIKIETESILDELKQYASLKNDYKALRSIYYRIASNYMDEEKGNLANEYFDRYIKLSQKNKDTLYIAYGLMNKGSVFNDYIKNPDSALYYFKKSLPVFFKYNDTQTIAYNYNNQGKAHYNLKDYNNALKYYLKADSIQIKKNIPKSELVFSKNLYEAYKGKKDYRNFSKYLERYIQLKDSINDINQNIAISEIKEQYDNATLRAEKAEDEKQILIEQRKKEKNKNVALLLGTLLLFGTILFFLLQKNTKRKQKLAEQEKELETQKLATILKEQELSAIDAMIEGQEKERQRIANDLHDDLGGLMATVKLHFNTLKEKQTPELYAKTNQLIDEAYNKIRTVAHAKNSGVIAKQGLLKAINEMANKISIANKITIDVIDHGLEKRLENSLELTIFRIIQELIANIVKHAKASEATINITNHEDSLNIMIEDNGKGFDTSKILKNNGMGLHSIEKRIEHLEGDIKIESQINQGTTIIIDIPL